MSLKPGTNYTVTKHTAVGGVTSVTKDPFSSREVGRTHISAQTFVVPTADISSADHCIQVNHNLSDGDAVVYWSAGGLHLTKANSSGINVAAMNPQVGEVDLIANTLHDANRAHGLKTGDTVVYAHGGGTLITSSPQLVTNKEYYVIKVDDNTIKLATTYDNAIAGTAIDLQTTGNNDQVIQDCIQDNETLYISRKTGSETSEFYLHANKNAALLSGGGGTDKLVIDNVLKGNNNQVFSTSFGRLAPTSD